MASWLVTFAEPGPYVAAEAVIVEADDIDQAAEEGLIGLLEAFPNTACDDCRGPIADHINVMPYDDVVAFDVASRPRRKQEDA